MINDWITNNWELLLALRGGKQLQKSLNPPANTRWADINTLIPESGDVYRIKPDTAKRYVNIPENFGYSTRAEADAVINGNSKRLKVAVIEYDSTQKRVVNIQMED